MTETIQTVPEQVIKKDKSMTQLTVSEFPNSMIHSTRYGSITFLEWITREGELIESRNTDRTAKIALHRVGRVSLWVNDVGMR